jgi:hypothetical protein
MIFMSIESLAYLRSNRGKNPPSSTARAFWPSTHALPIELAFHRAVAAPAHAVLASVLARPLRCPATVMWRFFPSASDRPVHVPPALQSHLYSTADNAPFLRTSFSATPAHLLRALFTRWCSATASTRPVAVRGCCAPLAVPCTRAATARVPA